MTQIPSASSSLPLTTIAKLKAKPGKKEGCLDHDMHRSTEDMAAVGRLLGHAGPGLNT